MGVNDIHEIRVASLGDDPTGLGIKKEAERTLDIDDLDTVQTAKVYRIQGVSSEEAFDLANDLLADPISQRFTMDEPILDAQYVVEVAYKPGVMNPEAASIMKAAGDLGIHPEAVDSSREHGFSGRVTQEQVDTITGRLLVNKTVQHVVTEKPESLTFEDPIGPVKIIPIRGASKDELMALSKDTLFLDETEMRVIQSDYEEKSRDPTDVELETYAAFWSEHCGHKTFKAKVMVRQADSSLVEKAPLIDRIMDGAKAQPNYDRLVVSAFGDNSGVMKFYEGNAICGKVETHNSPSAIEPYGGAMTGSLGVFRDIMGTGQGAKVVISTDMFCFAPPDLDERLLPPGTLEPDYLQRRVVSGVGTGSNQMGIQTANGSVHFHPDFRAKPTIIVGGYGILPEKYAQKGSPKVGDLAVAIGGRTGRDGIHGATFSSGEMTERTASVNSSAVQIGNPIEQKRMSEALLEARDKGLIRALTDCGAAGFCSAIGEMGEDIGVTIDLEKAPLKYSGLAPWEIWVSESQERMVSAIAPEDWEKFLGVCQKYNVEATVLGEFDGSNTLTLNYGDENVAELDYDFLKNGLPQRVMIADWKPERVTELQPAIPFNPAVWIDRLTSVLSHGNVCSKQPIVDQYDHGVGGGNIVPPFGGESLSGPNDALVVRPMLNKPYGIVQSHGMNPILVRHNPYKGTVWAVAEAASNYVAVGGDIEEAVGVGNYIWPFPDEESMGSLDLSVDAAVDMMYALGLPVISGKDSLSSTFRGKDGKTIKIPPVHAMSIFGRIPDVERTVTADIKNPGSRLFLVGHQSTGMAGSAYYDVSGGKSGVVPDVDVYQLKQTLCTVHRAIVSGSVLACHDVSEGGIITAIAEMCFGGNCGAVVDRPYHVSPNQWGNVADKVLFNETAGMFVVEVPDHANPSQLFAGAEYSYIGSTQRNKELSVIGSSGTPFFEVQTDDLKKAWQKPMNGIFKQ